MNTSRRHFIANMAGIGIVSVWGTPLRASAPDSDRGYKALLCINLKGGNDATNMLIPTSDTHYELYKTVRSHLAIEKEKTLPINQVAADRNNHQVELGLHPEMTRVQSLFNKGRANVILNSGILEQPLNKKEILAGVKKKPPQLFSHNSQSSEWHRGAVNHPIQFGWAGRMIDILNKSAQQMTPLYSLSGNTLWLRGQNSKQNILNGGKIVNSAGMSNPLMRRSYEKLLEKHPSYLFHAEINRVMRSAEHNSKTLSEILNTSKKVPYFSDSRFSQNLNTVFKLISQYSELQQNRQVFYVTLTGFDTHDDQKSRHAQLLKNLSEGVAQFYQAIDSIGMGDKVTTFTMSDFGRRIAPNDTGTDHGWGGHQIVIGDALKQTDAIGIWPDLTLDGEDDISRGRLIPGIASDQVGATLAKWMGIKDSDEMSYVFPNIHNFEQQDLRFLST